MTLTKGNFPRMAELGNSSAGLTEAVERVLSDHRTLGEVATRLLARHFPPNLYDAILDLVGLDVAVNRKRDQNFRRDVSGAYDHRCAVTGFRAFLSGRPVAIDAAHVHWFKEGGVDTVDNGLALTPTLHRLFDRGAWTLADDHRVLVSEQFVGSDEALDLLRSAHGRPLREPRPGSPKVRVEFIRWHRERHLGGVFKGPALT